MKNGCISILINWQTKKQKREKPHGRILWLYYSNTKEQKSIWGDKGKYHFKLDIPKIITIDTAYLGKKLGRLNLTKFFGKDYKVYSNGDDVQGL